MPRLILHPGRPDQRELRLSPGPNTIGRAEDNLVFVLDRSLSRHHASVDVDEDGGAVLRDLGSTNGTFVEEEPVSSHPLTGGETIRCGAVSMRFVPDRTRTDTETRPTTSRDIEADLTRLSMREILETPWRQMGSAEERLRILLKVSQLLASPASIDRLLETILDLAFDILDIDRAAILMVDPVTDELVPRVVRTRSGVPSTGQIFSRHIVEYVRDHSVAALFGDAQADPRLAPAQSVFHQSICASMCAPLKPRDEVWGVLYVDNLSAPDRFSQDDLDFLSAFANQAAVALDNASLYAELESQAVVRNTLLRFFPPATIGRIMEGDALQLETRETDVTALFCDISGFTKLSASMSPGEVLALLNAYFPVMADIVFRHEGTLEKYIGDALMAVWGAPFQNPDDPQRALRAAVEMQRALVEVNERLDLPRPLAVHIGLNTGPVAAGNVGSDRYIQYATLGDATNLASRICDLAPGGEIYVHETTRARLGDEPEWPVEPLGQRTIKGREEPLTLFSVRWRDDSL
jgi:adenylate cyclase